MKLTDKEIQLFRDLNQTPIANAMTEYLERVVSYVCDSRNWKDGDTKESVNKAAQVIEEMVIARLRLHSKAKRVNPNESE